MDITLAITAHSESIVAGPTLASAEVAVEAVRAKGLMVEKVVGLDNASDECREYFLPFLKNSWNIVELDKGDLGLARNALAEIAKGQIVAFLDADDLFSENWLVEGVNQIIAAEKRSQKIIAHPELNIFFDGSDSCLANGSDVDPLFTPVYWHVANYYDSLALAPRQAFLDVPYKARDKENGFGYEDWCWNLDTANAGWSHVIVRDTIIFKRRRDVSLLSELGQRRTLLWQHDAMAIEQGVRAN